MSLDWLVHVCMLLFLRTPERKNKGLDLATRYLIVRVSDQYGNQRETAPRAFPRVKSVPSSDGIVTAGATCRVWCEELQVCFV